MTTEKAQIAEQKSWLDANESDYLLAQEVLQDPKRTFEWLQSFQLRANDIMKFDPFVHPATAAVGVVCAAKERFSGIFEDLDFLEEYEDRRERWKQAIRSVGGLDPDDE